MIFTLIVLTFRESVYTKFVCHFIQPHGCNVNEMRLIYWLLIDDDEYFDNYRTDIKVITLSVNNKSYINNYHSIKSNTAEGHSKVKWKVLQNEDEKNGRDF